MPAKEKRKLTIEITFQPDDMRQKIAVGATTKSKLSATAPVSTLLYVAPDKNGEATRYVEATPQAPGQVDMYGGTQAEPKELRLVK